MAAAAARGGAKRGLWDVVRNGTLEELRGALPSDKKRRKAAVCVFHPENGVSLLTCVCVWGRWDMATALVQEHGHPVDLAEPKLGCTALHEMCCRGRIDAALFLIRTLGATPHAVAKDGQTALHAACQGGHTELARILVRDFLLNVDAVNITLQTPLHAVTLFGHTGTALLLINDLGARVEAASETGETPLMSAAKNGHTGTALALINIGRARIDAADAFGGSPLHYACLFAHPLTVSALLAAGARTNVKVDSGKTPLLVSCLPEADPATKPLVLAAFVRHWRLERLGREVLRLAGTWDHDSLKRAMDALMAAAAEPWACSAAVAQAAKAEHWTVPRHPLDMFREPATGRTALAVAAAAGIFRNAELLIQAAASPLELDCGGRTPWQLAVARGSDCMGVWFEAMPVVYWAGHSQLRYRLAATSFLLCCRCSRMRAPPAPPADEPHPIPGVSYMHPDDWCIPRRDVYRILHFVGPELWGSVWPGPPRGWRGVLPGRSPRPVRRVAVRLTVEGGAAAAAAPGAAAGCAQCGVTVGNLRACSRCRAASYCSGKCQTLHYPAHKAGCRAAGAAASSGI
jgi:ankyrin repeat protein